MKWEAGYANIITGDPTQFINQHQTPNTAVFSVPKTRVLGVTYTDLSVFYRIFHDLSVNELPLYLQPLGEEDTLSRLTAQFHGRVFSHVLGRVHSSTITVP